MADISSVVVPESGYKQRKCERALCFLCGQAPSAYNFSAVLPDDSLADNGTPPCKKQKGERLRNCSIQVSHLSSAYDAVTEHLAKNCSRGLLPTPTEINRIIPKYSRFQYMHEY